MVKIAIVFHSGYGHTARQAAAVHQGACSVAGASATLYPVNDLSENHWAELNAADAIIFGAPTYMGNASADFKKFADASSKPWFAQAWRNKIAGGFTNSASLNGDKYATLMSFVTLAMQHSMIWVGTGMLPANSSQAHRNDINRLGSFIGAMAQSDSDIGADMAPPEGDLATARQYGKRIAEITLQYVKGR